MAEVAPLKIKPRPGAYARSAETIELILNATLKVLTHDGYPALTLRRVATECGITVGNLPYHFPTKEALLTELLEAALAAYEDRNAATTEALAVDDRSRLKLRLLNVLMDIQSFQTTRLFPELWALANHNPEIADRLQDFYRRARSPTKGIVQRLNPALAEAEAETLALFFQSFNEGTTIFAGNGKPHASLMPDLAALATEAFVHLAETATPEMMHALRGCWGQRPQDHVLGEGAPRS